MLEMGKDSVQSDALHSLDCYSAHFIKWLFRLGLLFPFKMFWSCNKISIIGCQLQLLLQEKKFTYKTQTSSWLLKTIFSTQPPLKCGILYKWEIVRNRTASFSCHSPVQMKRSGVVQLPPQSPVQYPQPRSINIHSPSRGHLLKSTFAKTRRKVLGR